MHSLDGLAFTQLFREAYQKCFGHAMKEPVSEAESKLFSNTVFDDTGLVIGPKSIKNYSNFILNPQGKEENPSVATLDTLARYIMNAPYTSEIQRKDKESHYPYWFQYKNSFYKSQSPVKRKKLFLLISFLLILLIVAAFPFVFKDHRPMSFTDNFHSLADDSLTGRGWFVLSKDEEHWKKRNEQPGYLTLFTLKGDNWSDSVNRSCIKNLLVRRVSSGCFVTEVHLSNFFPKQNWQQSGILLLEDTNFAGRSLRLSFSYNDFYGGFPKSREIIIQAITSKGNSDKPEELAHQLVFKLDSASENIISGNLQHLALRVEKNGTRVRLLFANGSMSNSAFKEIINKDIDINPHFIGLFALKGFVDTSAAIPARFDFFSYAPENCDK